MSLAPLDHSANVSMNFPASGPVRAGVGKFIASILRPSDAVSPWVSLVSSSSPPPAAGFLQDTLPLRLFIRCPLSPLLPCCHVLLILSDDAFRLVVRRQERLPVGVTCLFHQTKEFVFKAAAGSLFAGSGDPGSSWLGQKLSFCTQSDFIKPFKSETGLTPMQFKASNDVG